MRVPVEKPVTSGGRPQELLFVSNQAVFKPPKAIRGGVPVCFPQFGKLGPLGQHGFARNTTFQKDAQSDDSVSLSLTPTQQQLDDAGWAHPFKLTIKARSPAEQTPYDQLCGTAAGLGHQPAQSLC